MQMVDQCHIKPYGLRMGSHLLSYASQGRWTSTFGNIVYLRLKLHKTPFLSLAPRAVWCCQLVMKFGKMGLNKLHHNRFKITKCSYNVWNGACINTKDSRMLWYLLLYLVLFCNIIHKSYILTGLLWLFWQQLDI